MSTSNLLGFLFFAAFANGCSSSSSGGPTPGPDTAADTASEAELDTAEMDTNKPDVMGPCTACVNANCKAEADACSKDDPCKTRVACLQACTDAACQKACNDANPGAAGDAYFGCIKDKCAADCTAPK